ncbi:MAG: porin family protein [Rickettsiales bacterium]|nr:porin family protein [Rickettsiales bacterium]
MKKILLLTTTLFVSTMALADAPEPSMRKRNMSKASEYYGKIELGVTMPQKTKISGLDESEKFKNGFVGGIGAGYRFNEFFRTDVMLHYRNAKAKSGTKITSGKLETYSAILNGYLDAHNDTIFTPYLMAGIGLGYNKRKATATGVGSINPSKTNFIWNVGAGVEANVYEKVNLGLGYRYAYLGRGGSKTVGDTKYKIKQTKTHEIIASLSYYL